MTRSPEAVIRLMIVEDEELIAEAHREYLRHVGGFEVVAAVTTAQEAMRVATAAAAGAPIELVLLDLGLPDARGVDLASRVVGVPARPDIIAITAQRELATVRTAMSHGVLLYLLKPFTFAAFEEDRPVSTVSGSAVEERRRGPASVTSTVRCRNCG